MLVDLQRLATQKNVVVFVDFGTKDNAAKSTWIPQEGKGASLRRPP